MAALFTNVSSSKYDEILMGILKEQENIVAFLDVVFGFFMRCTDFYTVATNPGDCFGFPQGGNERIVLDVLRKWGEQAKTPTMIKECPNADKVQKVELTAKKVCHLVQEPTNSRMECKKDQKVSECYNGAICDSYSWAQTISDIDIQVPLPKDVTSAKQIHVDIGIDTLYISLTDTEKPLVEGKLSWKCRSNESIWSLSNGTLQIHLEKMQERWWQGLLTTEPPIAMQNMDCSRPLDELPEDAQAKIQEMRWNQEQKLKGLPTSDEIRNREMLFKAWNAEGSPFKGTEFDPSRVAFH